MWRSGSRSNPDEAVPGIRKAVSSLIPIPDFPRTLVVGYPFGVLCGTASAYLSRFGCKQVDRKAGRCPARRTSSPHQSKHIRISCGSQPCYWGNPWVAIRDHPGFAAYWVKGPQLDPLPIDWPYLEMLPNPRMTARFLQSIAQQKGNITLLVEKVEPTDLRQGFAPLNETLYPESVLVYVRTHFAKVGETKYFELRR